jgi:lysophospholipase L1-like esterase
MAASASATAADGGLRMVVNERGRISQSTDAGGSLGGTVDLVVSKPASATVRKAFLAYATTGFSGRQQGAPLTLQGSPVPLTDEVANGISSYNYLADVTPIVRPVVDAAPAGEVHLTVVEPEPLTTEGEVLVVVFDDPSVTSDQSVTLLYGALSPVGDTYAVRLTEPLDLTDPDTRLEMSLGISYGWQGRGEQYSIVDVNGRRLTSAAGGYDDGENGNGALITAGGVGDSTANPPDPEALPTSERQDDELYDLRPFVKDGDTELRVGTSNPSLDDNVFLATFQMNPPVAAVDTGTRDFTLSPASQSAPIGASVTLTSPLNPAGLLQTTYAEVVDGPNAGRSIPVSCLNACSSLISATWRLDGPATFDEGTDTVMVWVDTDNDGVRGPEDPASTAQVTWLQAIHAVGMGDSYSSGEGIDPYDAGTDDDWGDDRNQCHRSAAAYSRVWQPPNYTASISTYLGGPTDTRLAFIACSGATTANVRRDGAVQYTEGATQLDQNRTDADTDLVTLSIGGNDIGFSTVLEACAVHSCFDADNQINGVQAQTWAEQRLAELPGQLDELLPQITEAAGNATVVLLGYPELFTEGAGCVALQLWDDDERRWLNDAAGRLDDAMRAAAARAGVHYVSVLDAFAGHGVCGPDGEFVNGPTAANLNDVFHGVVVGTGSFHPNAGGQRQYAATLRDRMLEALTALPPNRAGLPVNPEAAAARTSSLAVAPEAAGATADLGLLEVLPVDGDDSATCLPDGLVHQGSRVRVAGQGFTPGAAVALSSQTWNGERRVTESLGSATADASGRVAVEVRGPAGALDTHALVKATGAGPQRPLELIRLVGIARSCVTKPTFAFAGFFPPVDNLPTLNRMTAGRAVPVKFSLGGDQGLDVLASGSPSSRQVSCDSGAGVDDVETTVPTSAVGLTYDPSTGVYQYVWGTAKAWAGTCRALDITLTDGSTHTALFAFR